MGDEIHGNKTEVMRAVKLIVELFAQHKITTIDGVLAMATLIHAAELAVGMKFDFKHIQNADKKIWN